MSTIVSPAPYKCRFCGADSWIDPSDQTPPPDYCHESDHGSDEDRAQWTAETTEPDMTTCASPKPPTLSTAQLTLLQQRAGTFVDYYKPGLKLKELGLIDVVLSHGTYSWTINKFGERLLVELKP